MIATGRRSNRSAGSQEADQKAAERSSTASSVSASSAASRYDVLERVSEGTLFIVYRVRERTEHGTTGDRFGRGRDRKNRERHGGAIRALKALKGAYSRHEHFGLAALEVAQHSATLHHPHLAQVFEAGREEGTVFVVEEWLPGGSLEKRLRRVPLDISETLLLATELATALEYLHQEGVVHGDVRPRQVLFDAEGRARLNDIGLHEAFDAAGMAPADVQLDATLYTAPERCDGESATPACDLYSLGVVLYRAATGRVPFDGPSPLAIAMRHRNDPPLRPTQFNPDCPPELEDAIMRLLEKEADNRFASASEFLDALAPLSEAIARRAAATPAVAAPPVDDSSTANGAARIVRVPKSPTAKSQSDAVDDYDLLTAEEKERRDRLSKRQHKRREMVGALLAFFWLLTLVAVLAGIGYGAYYFWIKETPPEIRVPKYVGLSQRDAEILLANEGLKMRVGREVYNPKKPEGTVIAGDPQPGKSVRKGRFVLVTVSRGEEPIRMVDFADLTLDQARAIINRHGLRLGQIAEQFHTRVPKGYVCGQFPEPGDTFRRSDPINLVISRGPQPPAVAPASEELPVVPEPPSTSPPRVQADDPSTKTPPPRTTLPESEEVLVPRAAVVSVALPSNSGPQEIKILVRDATGDFTAYQETHEPGDVVDKTVQVVRPQSGTALVRVYVGGKLLRELRI